MAPPRDVYGGMRAREVRPRFQRRFAEVCVVRDFEWLPERIQTHSYVLPVPFVFIEVSPVEREEEPIDHVSPGFRCLAFVIERRSARGGTYSTSSVIVNI